MKFVLRFFQCELHPVRIISDDAIHVKSDGFTHLFKCIARPYVHLQAMGMGIVHSSLIKHINGRMNSIAVLFKGSLDCFRSREMNCSPGSAEGPEDTL